MAQPQVGWDDVLDLNEPSGNGAAQQQQARVAAPAPAAQAAADPYAGTVAPITDTGTTMGFADEAPTEAMTQLSPEDTATFYKMFRGDGVPKATADELRAFVASKGMELQNADHIVQQRDQGQGVVGQISYPLPKIEGGTSALMAASRGDADVLTLGLAPRIQAAIQSAYDVAHGGDWDYTHNLDYARGEIAADEEQHPYARIGGQLLGGLALPSGTEGVAFTAGRDALQGGASMAEARAIAAAAARNRMAQVGSAQGGLYGFDSSYGSPGERLANAAAGAITGAAGGLALGAAGEATAPVLARRAAAVRAAPLPDPQQVMNAADRQNIDMLPADVGGTFTKMATGAANMTLGGIPLAQAAQKSVDMAQAAKARVAEAIGTPYRNLAGSTDQLGAGLAAQRGVKAVLGDGGVKATRASSLYKAIPIADDANASVANTRSALSDLNAGLSSNPELSALVSDPRLQAYESAFTGKTAQVPTGILDPNGNPITRTVQSGGKLSWGDLQNFRSYIGELAGRPTLQDNTSKDALQRLYAGLSEDMRATAAQNNALPQFQRANTYYRALQDRKQQILAPLLGKNLDLNGEAAFRQIQQWASDQRGNAFAVGRALRSMPEDEANDIRATILDSLGTVSKGRQNGDGTVYSPNDFMTHWNALSSRAKANLFPDADYRQSIDDLVRIASAQKGAQQFANVSKTGNAVNGIALLSGFFTNPLATLPVALGQVGFGRVMADPRFARWLAAAANKPNAAAALAHINRLSGIAKSSPAIANDVLGLQQRLASAFRNAPVQAAAQPDSQDKQ